MESNQLSSSTQQRKINVPLTAKIKDAILSNQVKIGAGAGLIAGSVFVSARYFSPILEKEPAPEAAAPPVTEEHINNHPGCYVSTSVDSKVLPVADQNMNFDDVFAQQRSTQGPGGIFEYKGKAYNTFFKEEWERMTPEQKQDYYAAINDKLDPEASKILVSDADGNVATLSFGEQQVMQLEVLDENEDGIVDVASIDINFDGKADYTFPVESVVVHPESEAGTSTQNIIIDDSDYHLTYGDDEIEPIHQDDLTLINEDNNPSLEKQNIYNDDEIIQNDLLDIVDDFDMDEFNNL